jgi:YD repeat-containing protein
MAFDVRSCLLGGAMRGGPTELFVLALVLAASISLPAVAQTTTYTYDNQGRLAAATSSTGVQTTYAYDNVDNRTQVVTTGGAAAPPTAGPVSTTVAVNSANNSIALAPVGTYSTIAIGSAPSHGSASISGASAIYTPTAAYSGADSFTYTVTGPGGTSAPGTVSVTVATLNHAPVCSNKTVMSGIPTTVGPVNVSVAPITTSPACTDADGDTLVLVSASGFTRGAGGTVSGNMVNLTNVQSGGGTAFTYTISDGHGGSTSAQYTFQRN